MSASFALPEQIDGLEKLITLASLKKEDIIATQTEARKQLQLTQEVLGKVAEAKAFISQHASLDADLRRREDELVANKNAHEDAVKLHDLHVASENTRLENFSAQLDAKKTEQNITESKQVAEAVRLSTIGGTQANEHAEAMRKAAETLANAKTIESANIAEQQRLKEWEASLKAKAQRLRDQAASF